MYKVLLSTKPKYLNKIFSTKHKLMPLSSFSHCNYAQMHAHKLWYKVLQHKTWGTGMIRIYKGTKLLEQNKDYLN